MKFTSLNAPLSYKPWKAWAVDDCVVGEYIGVSTDNYGKTNYHVKVIEAGFKGGNTPAVGTTFVLNSNGALDHNMPKVSYGDVIKVTYKGQDTIEKGPYKGKKYHAIELEVADAKDVTADDDIL